MSVFFPSPLPKEDGELLIASLERTHQEIYDDLNGRLEDAPSDGSEYVRKNGAWAVATGGGGGSVYGFLKRTSTSTSTAAPTLIIPWDAADANLGTDITWSSGNNTRFTIATTGTYRVGGFVTYVSGDQRTQAVIDILINGASTGDYRSSSYIRNSGTSWDYWAMELSGEPFNLTAGDYVELALVRTSGAGATYGTGGSNTVTLRGQSSKFWIERVN